MIHVRLKNELKRLGVKPADAAKAIGESDSQGLRDVLGGRKRLTAEMLASLGKTGVNVLHVLFDDSVPPPSEVLSADERQLIALFRSASLTGKAAAIGALQGVADMGNRVSQKISGPVKGGVAGRDLIHKGRKHKNETGDQR